VCVRLACIPEGLARGQREVQAKLSLGHDHASTAQTLPQPSAHRRDCATGQGSGGGAAGDAGVAQDES
jgi:hypothetical protein